MDEIVNKIMLDNPELQFPPKPTYGGKYCCVVGCSNNQIKDISQGVKFHKFPKQEKRRLEWVKAVKRVDKDNNLWQPGPYDVICSTHFYGGRKSDVEGSPSYVPSIFPTHHVQPKTKVHEDRFERLQKFQEMREAKEAKATLNTTTHCSESGSSSATTDFGGSTTSTAWRMDVPAIATATSVDCSNSTDPMAMECISAALQGMSKEATESRFKICIDYSTQTKLEKRQLLKSSVWPDCVSFCFYVDTVSATEKATQMTSEMSTKVTARDIRVQTEVQDSRAIPVMTFDDRQFRSFCGIDKNIAQFLLLEMGEKLVQGRFLSRESKLSLVLVKLKLNCSFSALSGFYGISDVLARRIFFNVLSVLYDSVKKYLIWFDKATIKARMPKSFKALFPETRIIIDCSEIECETPSKLSQKVLLWSNYKSRYTAKFLVGIAPSGEVTFVSKGFGGRATDAQITVASGFLDLIEEGDIVMSDKGFPQIEAKVNEAGGIMVMPPFRKGDRQFSVKENRDGYQCASVRIHVERCIRRLKVFHILKFLPIKMLPHFNKIIVVLCFLNNCMNDLIKDCDESDDED